MTKEPAKPTLRAYNVQDAKTEGGRGHWIEVGALWPHKDGVGFDLHIRDGISLSGRVVIRAPREETGAVETP